MMVFSTENSIVKDYVAILSLLITVCSYIPILTLLVCRRKTQPIRHRSPYLLLTSLISSFLMSLSLSMILLLNIGENNAESFTCNFYIFNINVLHFILILPYIFRAYRLLNVFNMKIFNSNFQKNTLRESFYLKILGIFFILLMMLYSLTYLTHNVTKFFPVEVNLCLKSEEKDLFYWFRIIWIIIHGFECIIILYLVIRLKNIRDEFNISQEVLIVCCVWFGFEILFLINYTFNFMDEKVVIIIDVSRNYMTLIISGLIPLLKSFQALNIPICTTKECAANFNLLLITEKTYDAFYNYLQTYFPEGAKFLSFWTELNVFKHSNKMNGDVSILATDIFDKYLNENSELYIDFPAGLVENIHKPYQNANKNSYSDAFDSLGEYVYGALKDYYYPNFKISNEFRQLEFELEKDEVIYSRLVASSMISSLEIEV